MISQVILCENNNGCRECLHAYLKSKDDSCLKDVAELGKLHSQLKKNDSRSCKLISLLLNVAKQQLEENICLGNSQGEN